MLTFVQIGFLGTFLDISNFLRTSTLQCNKVVQFLMITLKGPISRWIYCTTSSNPTFSKIDGAFSTLVLNTRVAMGGKEDLLLGIEMENWDVAHITQKSLSLASLFEVFICVSELWISLKQFSIYFAILKCLSRHLKFFHSHWGWGGLDAVAAAAIYVATL